MRACGLVPALATGVLLAAAGAAGPAGARTIETYDALAPATPRAPTGPPLITAVGAPGPPALNYSSVAGQDASASAPASAGDPLVNNGLLSPFCRDGAASLAPAGERNCQTSGFEATAAPTANYALDVHIDEGPLSLNSATLVQDYLIAPLWMGLVWIVHVLIVAFEWCFTIDLPGGAVLGELAIGLRETQATFTQPWLAGALALASVAAIYHGIVRRRIAETLGQAMAMLAMMAVGLWVIMDPTGTVGALGALSNQTSLGTLTAVVDGSPRHGSRTLTDSMGTVFASAVGEPWCFLEFGNVGWCADPAQLDRPLKRVALRLGETGHSARLLREARTNGELFLALPANQVARNSINSSGSLLRELCAGSDATACHGPTAEVAEFRTASGTYSRLEGLILICIGVLGLIMLLGFLALHLLGSGLLSLLYLLLAPAVVLAPAFGERGRALFRNWFTRLLGSVTSKLLYAFLLGVVLLLTRLLIGLHTPGFWVRWMLLSTLWWGAFRHRHHALGLWGERSEPVPRAQGTVRRVLARTLPRPRQLAKAANRAVERPEALSWGEDGPRPSG